MNSAPMEFSPRSLCGMSQNQRKVLAWTEAQSKTLTKEEVAAGITQGSIRSRYRALFKVYRIGERLRPCPGCTECMLCIGCENGTYHKRCPFRTGKSCEGHSVLPARARKARR